MNRRGQNYAYLMVLFAALLFGCESVIVKIAYAGGWTVFSLMAARFTIAALIFAAAVKLTGAPWLVEKGQSVTKGTPLLVTEAMKMETTIAAPIGGIIGQIHVQAGSRIESGDCLVEIDSKN